MNEQMEWDDEDLALALEAYREYLSGLGLSLVTVESDVRYCRLFLRWRAGDYAPRRLPTPTRRPVRSGRRDLPGLISEWGQYRAFMPSGVISSAVPTYVRPPRKFLGWLGGSFAAHRSRGSRPQRTQQAALVESTNLAGLSDEFARIRDGHRLAIVRTVARMALLPSVTRVFETDTARALGVLLLDLPVDRLPEISQQSEYRQWFESALGRVAATILEFNPPKARSGIHPGYKWGHGTKVLSLFVRNLVIFSRYFHVDDAVRIESWLYCPIDGIVMKRLRGVGFDPGVRQINQIDEAAFWRIQGVISKSADNAGVPRVWFDDVWSEDRV